MKKSLLKTYLALVAMFCCIISVNAQATTYTGVTPESGKEYYLYCPETQQFVYADDPYAKDYPEYAGMMVSLGCETEATHAWTVSIGENGTTLSTKIGEKVYYLAFDSDKLGDITAKVTETGKSIYITPSGDYYTINNGSAYLWTNCYNNNYNVGASKTPNDNTNFIFVEVPGQEPSSFKLNISGVKYATFYDSKHAYVMPIDCQGYIWGKTQDMLVKTYPAGATVPAGEALVIYSEASGTKTLAYTTTTNSKSTNNALLGTDEATTPENDVNYLYYGLSAAGSQGIGFYWMANNGGVFKNGAHKAYLKVARPAGGSAPKMGYPFKDNTTVISNAKSSNSNNAVIYNLAGQRLNGLQKGINIVNGKKVLKK